LRRFEAKPQLVDLWEAGSQDGAMRFAYWRPTVLE
jgi:hypothetical protein